MTTTTLPAGTTTYSVETTVAAGDTLRFDPNVTSTLIMDNKNLIVRGTLQMRPANANVVHTLQFNNVVEANFVGGTITTNPTMMNATPLATDIGLWVVDTGVLDAVGTAKAGWNRTGDDPSWASTDFMLRTPWNAGDFSTFALHTKGTSPSTVVAPNGVTYTQECFNVTRNVIIRSQDAAHRAHVLISTMNAQTIKYARFVFMGPRHLAGDGFHYKILGRWAGPHLHHNAAGSLIEGCVVDTAGSHAFVSHGTDDTVFRDCIAYNVFEIPYWWDMDNSTDDSNGVLYDHCMAAYVQCEPNFRGNDLCGFIMGRGSNNSITDCVGTGVQGNVTSAGINWTEQSLSVWNSNGGVFHNNKIHGMYNWQNNDNIHHIDGFACFRNGDRGVLHGAYNNAFQYNNANLFSNPMDLDVLAVSGGGNQTRFTNVRAQTVRFGEHVLPGAKPTQFINCVLGHVTINEFLPNARGTGYGTLVDFVNCGLEPADFTVVYMAVNGVDNIASSSVYRVQRANGTAYQVNPDGTTTVISAFYAQVTGTGAFAASAASFHGTGSQQTQVIGGGAFAAAAPVFAGTGNLTGGFGSFNASSPAFASAGTITAPSTPGNRLGGRPFRTRSRVYNSRLRGKLASLPVPTVVTPVPSASGSGDPPLPVNRAANDILLLFMENWAADPVVQALSGWTEVPGSPIATPTTSLGPRLTVRWRRCTMTESAPHISERGDHVYAVVMAIRGCPLTGNPWDAIAFGTDDTLSSSLSIPGVTTTSPNQLIILAATRGNDANDSAFSGWANSNLANLHDDWTDGGLLTGVGGGLVATAGDKALTGATGATTVNITASVRKAYVAFSLLPLAVQTQSVDLRGGLPAPVRTSFRVRRRSFAGDYLRGQVFPSSVRGEVSTATQSVTGTGAMTFAAASFSGLGATGDVTGIGAFTAAAAILAGTSTETMTGTGAMVFAAASFAGTGTETTNDGDGHPVFAAASFAGTGVVDAVGSGNFAAAAAILAGTSNQQITGTGAFVTAAFSLVGAGTVSATGTGSFLAAPPSFDGTAVMFGIPRYHTGRYEPTVTKRGKYQPTTTKRGHAES